MWNTFVRWVLLPIITLFLTRSCTQVEERKSAERKFILFQRNVVEAETKADSTWRERLRLKRCDGGDREERPGFPGPGDAGAPAAVGAAAPQAVGAPDRVTFRLEAGL